VRVLRWVLGLAIVVAGVVGFYGFVPYGPTGVTFVEIASGTGTEGIAKQLEQAGVIRSRWAFEGVRLWRGWRGTAGTLKAGEYRFEGPASVGAVYDRLRRGDVYTITVLIPEGYNIFDVADAVAAAGRREAETGELGTPALPAGSGFGSREAFLQAEMEHTELVKAWSPRALTVEGFLFPDTYRFSRRASAVQMIAAMVKRFGEKAAGLGMVGGRSVVVRNADPSTAPLARGARGFARDDNSLVSMEVVVTMASLVEKEVHVDAERAAVAGVFENRLAAGMPLQTDPAVVYASLLRGTWTGVIHQSELKSDSAYNTYVHAGLPPGPICNPGLAALRAALHPAKNDYLYFVADAHGATRFSATLAQHNERVAEYRRAGSRQ
jgi:UPF0755 protein